MTSGDRSVGHWCSEPVMQCTRHAGHGPCPHCPAVLGSPPGSLAVLRLLSGGTVRTPSASVPVTGDPLQKPPQVPARPAPSHHVSHLEIQPLTNSEVSTRARLSRCKCETCTACLQVLSAMGTRSPHRPAALCVGHQQGHFRALRSQLRSRGEDIG